MTNKPGVKDKGYMSIASDLHVYITLCTMWDCLTSFLSVTNSIIFLFSFSHHEIYSFCCLNLHSFHFFAFYVKCACGVNKILQKILQFLLTWWFCSTSFRVPDMFSSQGVNKEFHLFQFPLLPPNQYRFSINLMGHEADLVKVLTWDPSFIWKTDH